MADSGPDPLRSQAWLDFNAAQWGITPLPVAYIGEGDEPARLDGVLYLDRGGRVTYPRVNPYLPFTLHSHNPRHAAKDWLALAPQLARELNTRGTSQRIILPADYLDARPFQWAGLRCGLYYTYYFRFPYTLAQAASDIRRRVKKAQGLGYVCKVHGSPADALACINESEKRKGFGYNVGLPALQKLLAQLGPEVLRIYVTYGPDGSTAAAFVALTQANGISYAFLTGSAGDVLPTGATQLNIWCMLEDLQAAGCTSFDYVGANTPSLAAAKAQWGCELVPHLTVEQVNVRALARDGWRMLRGKGRKQ
jgi:hypothetical protein